MGCGLLIAGIESKMKGHSGTISTGITVKHDLLLVAQCPHPNACHTIFYTNSEAFPMQASVSTQQKVTQVLEFFELEVTCAREDRQAAEDV